MKENMKENLKKRVVQKLEKIYPYVMLTSLLVDAFYLGDMIVDVVKENADVPFRGNEIVSDLSEEEILRTTNLKIFQTVYELDDKNIALAVDDRKLSNYYFDADFYSDSNVYSDVKYFSDPEEDAKALLLLQAIADNPNLTAQERDVFYRYYSYFRDNPYLNYQDLYKRLSTVEVHDYDEENDIYVPHAAAYYRRHPHNEIVVQQHYNAAQDMLVLSHEGFHATNAGDSFYPLPHCLLEGMNELIMIEYFSNYPMDDINTYSPLVNTSRMMCELVGEDAMLEAFTKNDYWCLRDALLKINPAEKTANRLLDLLDKGDYFTFMNPTEYQEFYQLLDHYYVQKYGQTIQDTPIMRNYNLRIQKDFAFRQGMDSINPLGVTFQDVASPGAILRNCLMQSDGTVVKYYFNKTIQQELGQPYLATFESESYYQKRKVDRQDENDFWLFWYFYVDGKEIPQEQLEPVIQKYQLGQESLDLSREDRWERYRDVTNRLDHVVKKDYNLYGTVVQKPMRTTK